MSKFKLQLPSAPVRDLDSVTDPAYSAVTGKVGAYSITPRTFVSKTLLARDPGDTHPARSVEEYEYCGNKVLRFCINAELISVDPTGTILGEGRTVPKAPTGSTTTYLPDAAKAAILHTVEKTLITEAIRHLHGIGGGAGARTVLIDIFERDNGAPIKIDPSSGHPLTHTVVLHKGPSTVQVIDPSNFVNSSHLANDDFNGALVRTHGLPPIETIHTARHGAIQIYKPDSVVGTAYAPDKYRNCTDVAVKLAFGFNKTTVPIVFDKDGIVKHPVVLHVSNNPSIDSEIVVRNIAARIKQDSSLVAQETFAKVQHAIVIKLQVLPEAARDAIKQEYAKIVSTPHTTLQMLVGLNDQVNQQLISQLSTEHRDITHDLQSYEAELTGLSTSP